MTSFSTGHAIILFGVAIATARIVVESVRRKELHLEISLFVTDLSNAITFAAGVVLGFLTLAAPDDGELPIGEHRLSFVIGAASMVIYGANQLRSAFSRPKPKPAREGGGAEDAHGS